MKRIPSENTFVSDFKEIAKPLWSAVMNVEYRGITNTKYYVVKSKGSPLLRREWFHGRGFHIQRNILIGY